MSFHIGTSGWSYNHWKKRFYPSELKKGDWLDFYSDHFNSVEINNTYYQLPTAKKIKNWKRDVPRGFRFSIKASSFITHKKKLKEPDETTKEMFKAIKPLKSYVGPILFQLPPNWTVNPKRFRQFVKALSKQYKYCFEFRNPSWYTKDIFETLEEFEMPMVIHDHEDGQSPIRACKSFLYFRFHGPKGNYKGRYTKRAINEWANKIKDLKDKVTKKGEDIDVFCYFNNDTQAFSVQNARELKFFLKN